MTHKFKLIIFSLAIALSAIAAQTPKAPAREPLQFSRVGAVELVEAEGASDVIAAEVSSWPIPNVPAPQNQNQYSYAYADASAFTAYSNVDIVQFEFNTISDFIEGKGIFSAYQDNSAKIVIANVYGFEHERALAVMKQAATSGLYASIITTDGPISAESRKSKAAEKYEEGEKYTNKISPDDLNDEGQGLALRSLLTREGGYSFRSPTYNSKQESEKLIAHGDNYITMSAFYRDITIGPIQHLKEKIMIVLKNPSKGINLDAKGKLDMSNIESIFVISGNANATPRAHNNLSRFINGSRNKASMTVNKFTVEHTNAILKSFAVAGKSARIDKIDFSEVIRVQSADGSIFERAYTDGKFEINDRMSVLLSSGGNSFGPRKATRGRNKYQDIAILNAASKGILKNIYLSHFVLTNRDFVDAMYAAWVDAKKAGHPFNIYGVLDGKFVGIRSFGLPASMKDIVAENPFGKENRGLGAEFAKHVHLAVNIERVRGATDIDPDGAPTKNVLQHGKMTIAEIDMPLANDEVRTFYIVTDGSMNMSGNESNLEVQDLMIVPKNNMAAEFAVNSVSALYQRTLEKTEDGRPRGYLIDEYLGIQAFAALVGLDVEQIKPAEVVELAAALEKAPIQKTEERKKTLAAMKAKILSIHSRQPSQLAARFRLTTDKLELKLNKINEFVELYSSLIDEEQGQINSFSKQERLDIIVSLTEDPMSCKRALERILRRNFIPFDVLEQRSYQIYQKLNMAEYFRAKGEKTPEFPINKNRKLPLLTKKEVAPALQALNKNDLLTTAQELIKIISQKIKETAFDVELPPAPEVAHRLEKVLVELEKLAALPNKSGSTYDANINYLKEHLIAENSELLLLTKGYERNASQIIFYILLQKGYRNQELRTILNQILGDLGIRSVEGEIKPLNSIRDNSPRSNPKDLKNGVSFK